MQHMKNLMILAFIGILGALLMAGVFMVRGKEKRGAGKDEKSHAMMRALAIRVGLSVGIFLLTLLAWMLGWIQPSAVRL